MGPYPISIVTAAKPRRLSKSFELDRKGNLIKTPGGQLVEGQVQRVYCPDIKALATLMQELTPSQALLYGMSAHEKARVIMQSHLAKVRKNGGLPVIARTREHFNWPEGPGILMFDYDPPEESSPLSAEGFRAAVYDICPALREAPHIVAASASSCIYNGDIPLRGASGWRMLVPVADAHDIARAGAAFFSRCWLKGTGYIAVSTAGTFLERGLVDPNVWQPERLDFCGGAFCFPPLAQKRPAPAVFNCDAEPLDTLAAIPSLSLQEEIEKKRIVDEAKRAAEPLANKKREAWEELRISEALKKIPRHEREEARERIRETYHQAVKTQMLLADFELQPESGGTVTAGQILDDPQKWHNRRFADPLEPDYQHDRRIAVANLFAAGQPFVYSHAHGGRRFTLHRARQVITIVKGERVAIVNKALELMRLHGQHFCRGGEIVKLGPDHDLLPRGEKELCFDLDGLVRFQKWDSRSKKLELADCPPNIAAGIAANRANWNLPLLDSIATAPLLDPRTGRLIIRDGYDAESRLILILNDFENWPTIPENPTEKDVKDAISALWKPFERFPFVGPTDRGVMLSAVLTATIRPLLPTAPAFAFDAPVAGSGKTLLAKCLSYLAGEKCPGVFPSTDEENEIRKRLLAVLRTNKRVIVTDNVEGEMESPALCSLLTSENFSDRILGESEIKHFPTRVLFLITGNNLALRGDLCRRVLTARIDPEIEQPWTRRFDLDPAEYCLEHRREMVVAALTVLRAGLQKGTPLPDRTGSFEVWSDSVRKAVVYAAGLRLLDLKDPIDSINTSLNSDSDTVRLRALLPALFEEWGSGKVTVAEMVKTAERKAQETESDETLLSLLKDIAPAKGGINNRALGKWLGKMRERVVGGLKLVPGGGGTGGVRAWQVKESKKSEHKAEQEGVEF
jgi:hypothetical protein